MSASAASPVPTTGELWPHLVEGELGPDVRAFASEEVAPVAAEIDTKDVYPSELVAAVARRGWTTLHLPEEYGGAGGGLTLQLVVMEEAAYASAALGISLITIYQAQKMILEYGAESLRKRYLPRFADGLRSAYALTEAAHGSDLRELDTKATRTAAGWRLTGEKSFITSGSAADLFVVLAQADEGVSVFVIPRDSAGVTTRTGEMAQTFGLRNGPHVNLVLDGAEVPEDHLVGIPGKGVRQAVTVLDHSRVLAAGISLGIARAAYDEAWRFASHRRAFGDRVIDFQGIEWYFADLVTEIDAARLLCYQAARQLDAGVDIARISSEAKLFASQLATRVSALAIRVCGARGTLEGAPYGRLLRDAVAYEVAGGSVEILRNTIAKSLKRLDEGLAGH